MALHVRVETSAICHVSWDMQLIYHHGVSLAAEDAEQMRLEVELNSGD